MNPKIQTGVALPPKAQARSQLTRVIMNMNVGDTITIPVHKHQTYTLAASNLYSRFKRLGFKMTYRWMADERHLLVQRTA